MSYVDFDEETWRKFQPQRAAILRESLLYTKDADMRRKIQETIDAIEQPSERRWWQFWKRSH